MNKAIKVIRTALAKALGGAEDRLLTQIDEISKGDVEQRDALLKYNLPIPTGTYQLVSIVSFAMQGFGAYLDPANSTFLFTDTEDGYTTVHYIAFNDMVLLHNDPTVLVDVPRLLPKVFLTRRAGGITCLKDRLNLFPTVSA